MDRVLANILERAYYMTLATSDAAGPWVAPVIYVHDEAHTIYWLSAPSARHSKALARSSAVAGAIVACWRTKHEKALQIQGIAAEYRGDRTHLDEKLQGKHTLFGTTMHSVRPGHLVWYQLEPRRIEITDNVKFRYNKKIWKR